MTLRSIKLVPNRRFPSIPNVSMDARNHTEVLAAMKEAVEVGKRDTSDLLNSYVRVKDLVDMGFATLRSGLLVPAQFATGEITDPTVDTDDQTAAEVPYDDTASSLGAANVQDAIDELASNTTATVLTIAMFFPGKPTNSQLMAKWVAGDNCILPANMAVARGHIGTNPTATTTLDVAKNGSNIGTISISTAGVFTFATTSGAEVILAPGDRITVTNQASADSTAADFGITLPLNAYIVGTLSQSHIEWAFFYSGSPGNNQLIWKYVAANNCTLPANFSTAYGNVGTNPTATATLTVSLNGATIGTISISTGGVFTFATTGGAVITVDAGDLLQVVAQASADATLANIGVTFLGTLT